MQCACAFLRSLIRTMHRLKRTDYLGFVTTSYNPSPRRMRSSRYATNSKIHCVVSLDTAKNNSKIFFKFGPELPKNQKIYHTNR